MSFRFWRRVRIAPGVTLNLSKTGGSLSFGVRGAHFTVGPHGKRITAGIPGTGLFYTTKLSGHGRGSRNPEPEAVRERLTLGFFKRLITPDDEEAFVDGCRELSLGNESDAFEYFQQATHLADGAWMAGFLALKTEQLGQAEQYLKLAAEKQQRLGYYFSKYGIDAALRFSVTDEITALVEPDLRGVLLGLVEIYQQQSRWQQAIDCLEQLRTLEPDDVVVKLSYAELLLAASPDDKATCKTIIGFTQDIANETPTHAALMLYKARALRTLGLAEAAKQVLTIALRRRKGRSDALLHTLRYERAIAYEEIHQHRRARSDLERIYVEDPDYLDVAEKLGL